MGLEERKSFVQARERDTCKVPSQLFKPAERDSLAGAVRARIVPTGRQSACSPIGQTRLQKRRAKGAGKDCNPTDF